MTFKELNIIEPILKALNDQGYTVPTPIQQEAIPIIIDGNDVLGCAQTGTGKTAAFSIPILQRFYNNTKGGRSKEIKALIITPTRELAIQIDESFGAYGKYTSLRHTVVFGGVNQRPQTDALRSGIDILIATPGRLLDLINQGFINLKNIEFFVLDEADRMLDMGFIHDIKRILPLLPKKRQTLFFSATMPDEIASLADSILHNPKRVEVTPASSTVDTIDQYLYFVQKKDKNTLLVELLKDQDKKSVLVFSRTKHGADKIAKVLCKADVRSEAIHGNKSQNARQKALSNFKDGTTRVLIATDIAARGIDVDGLTHVINFDLPDVPETYVHRIGRTGRAGMSGIALSFCDTEEMDQLKDIQKLIGKKITTVEGHLCQTSESERNMTTAANFASKRGTDTNTKQRPERSTGRNSSARSSRNSSDSTRGFSKNSSAGSSRNSSDSSRGVSKSSSGTSKGSLKSSRDFSKDSSRDSSRDFARSSSAGSTRDSSESSRGFSRNSSNTSTSDENSHDSMAARGKNYAQKNVTNTSRRESNTPRRITSKADMSDNSRDRSTKNGMPANKNYKTTNKN